MNLPPLSSFRSVHIIGCCGAGCAPLARFFLERGFRVSGSDLLDNAAAATLRKHGARIAPAGHRPENLPPENDGLLVVRMRTSPPPGSIPIPWAAPGWRSAPSTPGP
jgi:UDP-N-acetylmuramate--alanine ligase